MEHTKILGVMVYDRIKEAGRAQGVMSRHASIIRTRLGFHELSKDVCSRVGTILLVLKGEPHQNDMLKQELEEIGGVEVQEMQFRHG